MRTLIRRLTQLEGRFSMAVNPQTLQAAALLRERRHRRLESAGQPLDIPPTPLSGRRMSVSETLRCRRRERLQASGKAESSELKEKQADSNDCSSA